MGTAFSSSEEEMEQEPELPPFQHSSSPLSPQISMSRSPFFGPSLRNSDSYNAMTPVSLSPTYAPVSHLSRFHNMGNTIAPSPFLPSRVLAAEEFYIEVYLIRHGQSTANIRPELIGGRSPSATLTETGKREARALGAFLRSTGVVFDALYCSPLERAKQTAESVCQALSIPEEHLEILEELQELSQGQWEGRHRSEVYTREILQLMNYTQPDFRAPGGESQRQVEFRMVEFLTNILLPRAAIALQEETMLDKDDGIVHPNPAMHNHPLEELDKTIANEPKFLEPVNGVGKHVTDFEHKGDSNGDDSHQQDSLQDQDHIFKRDKLPNIVTRRDPEPPQAKRGAYRVAVFSHGIAIKCALRGLLGSNPCRTHQICIDTTSVTVLKHYDTTGWQVQRVNDTTHLRIL